MRSGVVLVVMSLGLAACGSEVAEGVDPTEAESEDALSTAGQKLAGAYMDDGGGTDGIRTLVLKKNGTFFSDVDSAMRCIRAPCPASNERVTGTYSASSKTVTLRSSTATIRGQKVLGRFNYVRTDTELTLQKGTEPPLVFATTPSYCSTKSDCTQQNFLAPACSRRTFECADNKCVTHCGGPLAGPPP